jgi:hypothetical protein
MLYETQGELTGSLKLETATVISSQATGCKRSVEGSETRGRAKAVTPPRAPCSILKVDDDIVRHSDESRRASLNS